MNIFKLTRFGLLVNDTEFWQLKPTLLETFEYNGDKESKAMTQGNIILNLLGDRSLASGGI